MERVLFSWIGFKDLNYIADRLNDDKFSEAVEREKSKPMRENVSKSSTYSPIHSVIKHCHEQGNHIDRLIVFCDLDCKDICGGIKNFFEKHAKEKVKKVETIVVRVASQEDVHNYSGVVPQAAEEWKKINGIRASEIEAFFNLSSGTTQMKSFLTIAGQACYREKAKLFELEVKEDDKVCVHELPSFDITSFAVNERMSSVNLDDFDPIIGESAGIIKAKIRANKAAATDCNVLIYGETGTGKELFAQAIHDASKRKGEEKFHAINCATLSGNFLESRLFGHIRGAFTDAIQDRDGLIKKADNGTLFLDEVYACTGEVQEKLLRVLQPRRDDKMTTRRFTKMGSDQEITADVRIIAATNEPLDNDDFRNDLLNRLSTLTITLPPLRERAEDIPLLIDDLMKSIKKDLGEAYNSKKLCAEAESFLKSRYWKGNVRELKNALYHAIVFGDDDEITEDDFADLHLPAREQEQVSSAITQDAINLSESSRIDIITVLGKAQADLQKKYVQEALRVAKGKKNKAAKILGTSPQTLDNWKAAWEKLDKK